MFSSNSFATTRTILAAVFAALSVVAFAGCGKSSTEDKKYASSGLEMSGSEDDRVYQFADNDAAMNAAIDTAKKTCDQFIAQLKNPPKPGLTFNVKKKFPAHLGGFEHIWIGSVTFDGQSFHG